MSNTCKKCGGNNLNEVSGECAVCSNHRHYDFKKAYNTNTETDDEQLNEVLRLLRSGKKWRVQKVRNSDCWHPGVKMTNGKCVFCNLNNVRNDKRVINLPAEALARVREQIASLREYEVALELYISAGYNALPPCGDRQSARQQAISSGAKWYLAADPCKYCGVIGERYVANGRCRSCGK